MGVQKRGPGRYEVFVYDPAVKKKRYVGSRAKRREADELFEDKRRELRGKPPVAETTVDEYADRWLEFKHGENTRRPRPGTLKHNRQMLKAFRKDYGDHVLASIPRHEALDWCLKHRSSAKTVSAMFNDAVNDGLIVANPFANRQHKQMRGRKDIVPITEAEVDLLARIAVDLWGEYGRVCKAWILWSAWVGTRPGETFTVMWRDLDLQGGLVTVKRVKPPYNTDTIPVARKVLDAIREMRAAPEGELFKTVTGRPVRQGGYSWYWDKVRAVFESKIESDRRDALREDDKPLALYSLRHFCASIIVANGGNEYDVSAQLGNTPEVARETYIHQYADDRRRRLRGFLDGAEIRSLDEFRENRGG